MNRAHLATSATTAAKELLAPILFRYPPIGLEPERLQLWLRCVLDAKDIPGAVVEIGCNVGGTSAVTYRMMRRVGIEKRYVSVDTFSGFVGSQYSDDVARGNTASFRNLFSTNSERLTRRVLKLHGASDVETVRGDIAELDIARLPERVAVALLDVDLALPTYHALTRIVPLLSTRGIILVDDCAENDHWQARKGYAQYCAERGLEERYQHGMGLFSV